MPVASNLVKVAAEWAQKAENDLKNATHALKLGRSCPTDTVCFHVQQCAEKYLKAILVCHGIAFPKTHDIEVIVSLMPAACRMWLAPAEQQRLTFYAVATRYPGCPPIPLKEAREAVALARRVRSEARRALPRAAVRMPKPGRKR